MTIVMFVKELSVSPKMYSLPWSHANQSLYRLPVLGAGSCFFHSLLSSTDPDYLLQEPLTKGLLSNELRKKLASSLTIQDFLSPSSNGVPLYQDLPQNIASYRRNDYTMESSEINKIVLELESLKDTLPADHTDFLIDYLAFREYIANPGQDVGDEIHLLASRLLDVNIYITTGVSGENPGYMFHDPALTLRDRSSIILFNSNGHWEPVFRVDNELQTFLFPTDDSLILYLKTHNESCWSNLSHV